VKKTVLKPTQLSINVEAYKEDMIVVTFNDKMCRVFELALNVLIMPPSARDTITTMNSAWVIIYRMTSSRR
jgi:hypothetical protein